MLCYPYLRESIGINDAGLIVYSCDVDVVLLRPACGEKNGADAIGLVLNDTCCPVRVVRRERDPERIPMDGAKKEKVGSDGRTGRRAGLVRRSVASRSKQQCRERQHFGIKER